MRTRLALTIAGCTIFAPAAFAADISTPAPPMSPVPAGHEVLFDGTLGAVYAPNSSVPWSAVVTGRATVLSSSGWGASLIGIDQASLSGVSVNVVGAELEVYKNFASGAIGGFYHVMSGNGITVTGGGLEGAVFAGNAQLRGSISHTFGNGPIPAFTSLMGQAAYFFAPNTQGYASVTQTWNSGASSDTAFSIGAEHKLQSSPISVFAGLAYSTSTSSMSANVGIRFTSAALSLQDFTRKVPF